jgi:hypothetical protein
LQNFKIIDMNQTKNLSASVKLGRLSPRYDIRTIQFANYIDPAALPDIPAAYNWSATITAWGMMKNDTVGDCTCAAAGHMIMEWTANNGKLYTPFDAAIVKAYSIITGYDAKTGMNDNGAVAIDVLNFWRKEGIANHKIAAYAALEPGNHFHVKEAVYLFGGCYIGLGLPISAQEQAVWSVPPGGAIGQAAAGSWGGHAVPVVAYDVHGLTIVTWGQLKKMTWGFWDAYCEEAYAIISPDFLKKDKAPNGFDLAALQADLKTITA